MQKFKYGKEEKEEEKKEKKIELSRFNSSFGTGFLSFFLLFSLAFSLFFLLNVNLSFAWLEGWQYRKPITITEQSGNTLTDYQVRLEIDTASLISQGKMNSDCSDIRFTDENDNEIPYWIESGCNSANTVIWVKVPEIPTSSSTTIYMYYGNSDATSESNVNEVWGGSVFAFYDFVSGEATDWVGGYNLTCDSGVSFTSEGADFSSASGTCYYDYVSGDGWYNLHDLTVVIVGKVTDTGQSNVHFNGLTTSTGGHVKTGIMWASSITAYRYRFHDSGGNYIYIDSSASLDTDWHIWVAWQDATNGNFKAYKDNSLVGSRTWGGSYYFDTAEYWSVGGLKYGSNDLVYKQVIKRVIVYDEAISSIPSFYYPEPTYSIGSEETQGFSISIEQKTQYDYSSYGDYGYGTCCDENYCYSVGYTYDEGDGDDSGTSLIVYKIDKSTGSVVDTLKWEALDGSADDDYELIYDCEIINNYLYVVGYAYGYDNYQGSYMAKIDLSTFSLSQEYDLDRDNNKNDGLYSIDWDGSYIYVTGYVNDGDNNIYVLVMKLDASGNVLNEFTYDLHDNNECRSGSSFSADYGRKVIHDDSYIYVGGNSLCYEDWDSDGANERDDRVFVFKLNKNDLSISTKYIKDIYTLDETSYGAQYESLHTLTTDGNYIYAFSYYTENDNDYYKGYLIKLDLNLNEISTSTLDEGNHVQFFKSKYSTYKYLIVFGNVWDGSHWHQKVWVFDTNLNKEYENVLDNNNYDSDLLMGKFYLEDLYIYVSGYDVKPGNWELTFYILKMNLPNQPPQITILSPTNSTYYTTQITLQFNVSDDNSTTFWVKAWIEDNLIYENQNYQNNTLVTIDLSSYLTLAKTYYVKIWANDTNPSEPQTSEEILYFTIDDYEIENTSFEPYAYETSLQNYSIIIRVNWDLIKNITLNLNWNQTYKGMDYQITNSTHLIDITEFELPLIQTNNTEVPIWWELTFYENDGNDQADFAEQYLVDTPETQHLIYAYWINSVEVDPSQSVEGDLITANLYYHKEFDKPTFSANFTCINEDSVEMIHNELLQYFYWQFYTPKEQTLSNSYTCYFTLNISYNNEYRLMSDSATLTNYKMIIAPCNSTISTQTLKISIYNEKTFNPTNATLDVLKITLLNNNVNESYSYSNQTLSNTFIYCIYPSFADVHGNVYFEYSNSNSPKREYYVLNNEFSSEISEVKAYLLNYSYASYTNVYVYDVNNQKMPNVYVRILKFNPNTNSYETMFIGKTDESGLFPTYLEPLTQPYSFVVFNDENELLFEIYDKKVSCEESCPPYVVNLYEPAGQIVYNKLQNVYSTWSFNNQTYQLYVEVHDDSGITQAIKVQVYEDKGFGYLNLYDEKQVNSSSIIYTKTLHNQTENWILRVYVKQYGVWFPLLDEAIKIEVEYQTYGSSVFLIILFLISLSALGVYIFGLWGLPIAHGIGLFMVYILKLLPIDILAIIGFLTVECVIIYMVRRWTS